MHHPVMAHDYARFHQQEMLKQAEQRRLVSQAKKARRANRANLMDRAAQAVGTQLVEVGERLKARPMSPEGEAI